MNRIIIRYNIKPCDEIIVPKSSFNIVQHHVMYLGFDYAGTDWIIENNFNQGVRLITADEFFTVNPFINKINRFDGCNDERKIKVRNALTKIGKPYNLINYNCEHFTTEIRTGISHSKQVQKAAIGLIAILFIGALLND